MFTVKGYWHKGDHGFNVDHSFVTEEQAATWYATSVANGFSMYVYVVQPDGEPTDFLVS